MNHFHIDTGKLPLNRFMSYQWSCEQIQVAELAGWMADSIYLLLEMERANQQYCVFDPAALARTLRKYWNWMIDKSLISKAPCMVSHLPHLPDKTNNLFGADLAAALPENGFAKQLGPSGGIISIVSNHAALFASHLTRIFGSLPVVVVFGVGYFCNKFLSDHPDIDNLFNLIGFCDNDRAKHGQTKHGRPIFAPNELLHLEFDHVLIATMDYHDEVHAQLTGMGLPAEKMLPLDVFRYKARP